MVALHCCNAVFFFPTASLFALKNTEEESMKDDRDEEEDDLQSDEEEGMEVDKQVVQKRKKVSRCLKY